MYDFFILAFELNIIWLMMQLTIAHYISKKKWVDIACLLRLTIESPPKDILA